MRHTAPILCSAPCHWVGAGLFVFQIFRWTFHSLPSCFHTTTYLPVSIIWPPAPSRVTFPTS